MDKFTGFAQENDGDLITTGTPTIRVTNALTDTLVPIYSSDSLAAAKANPFTLPASGKIEFHARNGKVRVKMINGAVETPIEDVLIFAGHTFGILSARPAAGSADRLYTATDTGVTYRDNGTSWERLTGADSGGHGLQNGTLVASVNANALTIAIKTLTGADPSVTDPVIVLFRNVTAALGDYTAIALTAATSFVASNGSNFGASVNNTPFRLWFVGFNDAGTFRLGAINCVETQTGAGAGRVVSLLRSLNNFGIDSSTAEGGAGGADTAGIFYTGTAVAAKAFAVLGYASYEAGLAAAGAYAATPPRLELYGPQTPRPGQLIQLTRTDTGAVASGTTAIPDDDTIPQITEGDQYMSRAITPSSAANVLDVSGYGNFAHSGTVPHMRMALFQDAVANALAIAETGRDATANGRCGIGLRLRMLAALAVSTTLRLRAGNSTGATTTFNGAAAGRRYGGVYNSYIEVAEIMG